MLEDDQKISFLQINKDSLIPFKYSEMILNYEGKMIDEVNRMEGDLQTTEDDLQTMEDDWGMMEDDKIFIFKITRPVWSHLNVLKWW